MTLDEFLAGVADHAGPVIRALVTHLESLDDEIGGELVVDPIDAGVLFKHGPTVAMARPRQRWTAVEFGLGRALTSSRLSRKVQQTGSKRWHVVNVVRAEEIDDELREWLTEAYLLPIGGRPDEGGDGMIPDDVDVDIDWS